MGCNCNPQAYGLVSTFLPVTRPLIYTKKVKSISMDTRVEWLNNQIERMQADLHLLPRDPELRYEPDEEDLAVLQMAALFNSLRPDAGQPQQSFLSDLRSCVLAVAEGRAEEGRPRFSRL